MMAGNKLTKSQVFKKLSEVQARASLRAQVKLDNCDRTKVIMACSTGKTYVGSDVVFKLKSKVNVVTVPSLQLVQQWIDRFRNDRRLKGYSILPVCSKIGIESPEDYGIENATTDRVAILDACKKHQPVIIIVTYQSYPEFAAAVNGEVQVGFLVADEAHRTAGIKNKFFASCLDDKVLKIAKRLFMTATPIVYRGDSKTVYCMNDRDSYGDVAFNYPYSQARDAGVVAPMRVHIFGVPTGESADTLNSMIEHKQQAMLAETLAKLKLRPRQRTRMLVFHNGIQSSKAFCEKLRSMGIWAEHLNGRDSVKKRLEVIDRFSNHKGPSVICSVRVFSEGVDAPEIDTIVFSERKSSPVDINQNTGRGTRWTERKNYLTVLLPYYTEFAMTQKEMRDSLMESKYGPLMEVMAAISSIDDAMAEYRIVPPEDVDDIAASSVNSESCDAVQPVVPVVKDAPVITGDTESYVSDVNRRDVPLVNHLTLVKRLPIEVSVVTDSGEFDASEVRERYIHDLILDWPVDFDEMCKVVIERFGERRPTIGHPLYRRFTAICCISAMRNYTGKNVLDSVYGEIAKTPIDSIVWPNELSMMKNMMLDVFGDVRPVKHQAYNSYRKHCYKRGWSAKGLSDVVYGKQIELPKIWPDDIELMPARMNEVFGGKRPSVKTKGYNSFCYHCRKMKWKSSELLNLEYGEIRQGEYKWTKMESGIEVEIKQVFGNRRPSSSHAAYRSLNGHCGRMKWSFKKLLDNVYGVLRKDSMAWPKDKSHLLNKIKEVFGNNMPTGKHDFYDSFRHHCKNRGLITQEILNEAYGQGTIRRQV